MIQRVGTQSRLKIDIIFTFYLWFPKLKIPVLFLRIKSIGIIYDKFDFDQ